MQDRSRASAAKPYDVEAVFAIKDLDVKAIELVKESNQIIFFSLSNIEPFLAKQVKLFAIVKQAKCVDRHKLCKSNGRIQNSEVRSQNSEGQGIIQKRLTFFTS
jgi:hypothetical protein